MYKCAFSSSKCSYKKCPRKIIFIERARSKHSFQFTLYNYIRENNFRVFSADESIFTMKQMDCCTPVHIL